MRLPRITQGNFRAPLDFVPGNFRSVSFPSHHSAIARARMNRLGEKNRFKCKTTKEKSLIPLKKKIYTKVLGVCLVLLHKAPLIPEYITTQPTTLSRKHPILLKSDLAPRECHPVQHQKPVKHTLWSPCPPLSHASGTLWLLTGSTGDLSPAFNHQTAKEKEGSLLMEIFSVIEACFSSGRHGALYTVNRLYLGLSAEKKRKGFCPEHHLQLSASSAI